MPELSSQFRRPSGNYLLNHSVGVPPSSVREQVGDVFVGEWLESPHDAWERWSAEIDRFHAELGRLLNHDPQWFCHQVNLSSGLAKILQALPVDSSRPVILLSERSFPTVGYVADAAARLGYRTRLLPRGVDSADPERWREALEDDVGVVVLTHAESNTGVQLPIASITSMVRDRGATSVVDVAQSAGVLPIDLRQWAADFVVGTSAKWLCGGPGAGFLWVDPAVVDRCSPIDVGWFSHDDPFEFDINDFRFAPDARRFWGGTPSPMPAAIARHSIAAISDIGIDAVRQHNVRLTDHLIDGLDPAMLVSPRDAARRNGTVVVGPPADRRAALIDALADADVHVDERADGIRVSPHLVNTLSDIDAFLDIVAAVGR
jgi:selenocysteine lyase/cysteine desulfurase